MHGVLYFLDLKPLNAGFNERLVGIISEYHLGIDQACELFRWMVNRAMWRVLQDMYNCKLQTYFPNQLYQVIYEETQIGYQFELFLYDLLKARNLPFRAELQMDSMMSSDHLFYMTF